MTVIEFLRSLSWVMDLYEVEIHWNWEHKCPVCGKYYESEEDEYIEESPLADYRVDSLVHLDEYPGVYNTRIEYCRVVIEENRIIISHTENADEHICEECESMEEL